MTITQAEAPTSTTAGRKPQRAGRYPIAALAKALDLIDVIDAEGALTLTELGRRAGINKATALRVLANLEERGYVERDATGRYRLGVRLLQLGVRASERLDLRTVARPVLERLRAEFEETVNLAVPSADGIVYIDILESGRGLRMAAAVGARDDYHSTALGKAIIAHWPAGELDDFLRCRPLPRKTSRTIVDPASLASELARVRERGYAIDDEENEAGARCLAVPIFDHGGVVGAISLSGPASRLTPERLAAIVAPITAGGRQVSAQMGFREGHADDMR